MTASGGSLLRAFVNHYDLLLRRLTSRLGSRGAAEDALHDAYVKLSVRGDEPLVSNPTAYVMRAALNAASDRRTLDQRRKTEADEEAVLAAIDDRPDPERIAMARSEWAALELALKSLPQRRQEIFLSAWVEEIPYSTLAERYGVTVRTIQTEVKRALEHCALSVEVC